MTPDSSDTSDPSDTTGTTDTTCPFSAVTEETVMSEDAVMPEVGGPEPVPMDTWCMQTCGHGHKEVVTVVTPVSPVSSGASDPSDLSDPSDPSDTTCPFFGGVVTDDVWNGQELERPCKQWSQRSQWSKDNASQGGNQ